MTRVGSAWAVVAAAGVTWMVACGSVDPVAEAPPPVARGADDGGALDARAWPDIEKIVDARAEAEGGSHSVSGTVSGLLGQGLLLEANGQVVSVPKGATSFALPVPLALGTPYHVVTKAQPTLPTQVCLVARGDGTVTGEVRDVSVSCATSTYVVAAAIMGLRGGGLVLQNNGGDDASVAAGSTSASFGTKIPSGGTYEVTIASQPVGQRCTVASGRGTIVAGNVTVAVNCIDNTYTVGGNVTGLAGTGLVLQNELGDVLPVNANGTFAFASPKLSGSTYNVTVKSHPKNRSQTCTIANNAGTVAAADVTNVAVSCTTNTYVVSATVTGLLGGGASARNNGGPALPLPPGAPSTVTFPVSVASGDPYDVTVPEQPSNPYQTCTVTGGAGTVTDADVRATITCATLRFPLTVEVSGMSGAGLAVQAGTDTITVNANGTHSFPTQLESGSVAETSIVTQPNGPGELCVVMDSRVFVGNVAPVVRVWCGPRRTAFISSAVYNGNLGGFAGADAKCEALAAAAGLLGTYKAALGDRNITAWSRLAKGDGVWTLVDGTIACVGSGTRTPECVHAVNLTELGTPPPASTIACGATAVFTEPHGDARYRNCDCDSWTSSTTAVGSTGADWRHVEFLHYPWCSDTAASACARTAPLLCYEQ